MSIIEKINLLKKQKNAVILAHNYQLSEIQDIADYTGDSLGLSIEAAKTTAEVIVFCGVSFMAETAKVLSPEKTVLLPVKEAGCPMANMITADQLRELKLKHPYAKVLCYVNSTVEVKAESDVCCTSANATEVVQKLLKDKEEIIFVPDKYLAHYTHSQTQANIVYWNGYCPSHLKILPEDIKKQKELYPAAKVMVHPECTPEVIALADGVLSTAGMSRYAESSCAKEFIVGTEPGMVYRLEKDNPGKRFYPATAKAVCPDMKKTTLESLLWCLEDMKHEVVIAQDIMDKARTSIENMVLVKSISS